MQAKNSKKTIYICTQSCKRPISGDFIGRYRATLSADISNIGRFLLQTTWRTIFPYRIGSRQKRRYRTISRPT